MKLFALAAAFAAGLILPVFAQSDVAPQPKKPEVKAAPPPWKPAAVDLSKIFDKWKKVKDFTDDLEAQKKSQEAQLKDIEKTIKEKRIVLDTPAVSPKIRIAVQLEIVQLQAKADFMMKSWNDQVKQILDDGIGRFYDDIAEEVAAYAKENGYTMVFKLETEKVSDKQEGSRVDEKISRRPLLYADPGFDITDDILARLDAKYEKEKAANPPPKDPEPPKDNK